jgi:hypothetical protein
MREVNCRLSVSRRGFIAVTKSASLWPDRKRRDGAFTAGRGFAPPACSGWVGLAPSLINARTLLSARLTMCVKKNFGPRKGRSATFLGLTGQKRKATASRIYSLRKAEYV